MLLALVFAGSIGVLGAADNGSVPAQQAPPATAQSPATSTISPRAAAGTHYRSAVFPHRAQMYYEGVWGIDDLKVKYTESGEMIRFSYRVLDATKAAQLNDKKAEPSLIDPQAGAKLVIPQMEKVGKLRQSSTPITGKSYWMAFSNKGRLVRPGHRVAVEIGDFRAVNLLVE